MVASARKKSSRPRTSNDDVAGHLRTPQEMAAYLDAWLDEAPDDVSGIARALGDIAHAKGMSQGAKAAGLGRERLYRALSEAATPASPPCSRWLLRPVSVSAPDLPERRQE
jgi:probable addiction module antidote protein